MINILKFKPIFKERIWGGRQLETSLGKRLPADKLIGESWELSGVDGDVSIVCNGKLKGNSLQELIEIYMGDLVGDKVYEEFGDEFPLLIKLIDAQDNLSIQVHPGDELSEQRHHSYGKTEMWYVVGCELNSQLYLGFKEPVDRAKYIEYLENGRLEELLTSYAVKPGDTFFIPSGAIHAIGKGILIAEIQQTSDITYRVYDFNRVDANGAPRELHTDLALDAIDYNTGTYDVSHPAIVNQAVKLVNCKYFTTEIIEVDGSIERDYETLDSFVIYICIDGSLKLTTELGSETINCGETVLIAAIVESVTIEGSGKIIETYVDYR